LCTKRSICKIRHAAGLSAARAVRTCVWGANEYRGGSSGGVGAPLSNSPAGSSEQHYKHHKAQDTTNSTAVIIDGAGCVLGDDPRSSDAGQSTDPLEFPYRLGGVGMF
jgi:hypothetical protein